MVQKFWNRSNFIQTENLGRSRNSGAGVFSFNQKVWAGPEILEQAYFHSYRKSGLVQKFWTN
jgi:hypothetical protein